MFSRQRDDHAARSPATRVSFTAYAARQRGGSRDTLTNAPTDGTTVTIAERDSPGHRLPYGLEGDAAVITNSSTYKNHGEYVSSQGGGSDAAHSCIGMPIHVKGVEH